MIIILANGSLFHDLYISIWFKVKNLIQIAYVQLFKCWVLVNAYDTSRETEEQALALGDQLLVSIFVCLRDGVDVYHFHFVDRLVAWTAEVQVDVFD